MNVVDISSWQEWGEDRWQRLKDSGTEGVIIKIGEWDKLDDWFVTHVNNAVAFGLKYGVYYYGHASSRAEAVKEADTVAAWLKEYLRGETPELGIWYDAEDDMLLNGRDSVTDICMAFLNRLTDYGHQYEGIYSSWNWLSKEGAHHIDVDATPGYVPIWVAQYNRRCDLLDEYADRVRIWQYTDSFEGDSLDGDEYYTEEG